MVPGCDIGEWEEFISAWEDYCADDDNGADVHDLDGFYRIDLRSGKAYPIARDVDDLDGFYRIDLRSGKVCPIDGSVWMPSPFALRESDSHAPSRKTSATANVLPYKDVRREIHRRYLCGESIETLAREYYLTRDTIAWIVHKERPEGISTESNLWSNEDVRREIRQCYLRGETVEALVGRYRLTTATVEGITRKERPKKVASQNALVARHGASTADSCSQTARTEEAPKPSPNPATVDSDFQKGLWKLTRGEYHRYRWANGARDRQKTNLEYRGIIARAVSAGKSVDSRILAQYPNLMAGARSLAADRQDADPPPEEPGMVDVLLPFWLMTRGDYHKHKRAQGETDSQKINQEFRRIIEQAVREGKPVDPCTLAEYPDLRAGSQLDTADEVRSERAGQQESPSPSQSHTESPVKPLWQMTRADYHKHRRAEGETDCRKINQEYKGIISKAVSEGKPVDPRVLAEYPDLTSSCGGPRNYDPASSRRRPPRVTSPESLKLEPLKPLKLDR